MGYFVPFFAKSDVFRPKRNGIDHYCCHHLQSLVGYNALIEGDSFAAIQWGSDKASYPWRLVDWVKEVWHISTKMNCKFSHVPRGVNVDANVLARVSCHVG